MSFLTGIHKVLDAIVLVVRLLSRYLASVDVGTHI